MAQHKVGFGLPSLSGETRKTEEEKTKGPQDKEMKVITKAVEVVARFDMEGPAVFILEVVKPLAYVGGQFARFFLAPFLPIFGESGDNVIVTLEKESNIENMIKLIEEGKKEKQKRGKKAQQEKTAS